jgi:hypothetical protein
MKRIWMLRLLVVGLLFVLAACTSVQAPATVPGVEPTPSPPLLAQEEIVDVALDGALLLSGPWRFKEVTMFDPQMAAVAFDDSAWEIAHAPARWEAQGLGHLVGTGAVVVYRRTLDLPVAWAGQPIGVSAWFNPYAAQVFVNGVKVEPLRIPFAPYADITELVTPGEPATIAVVTLYDGVLDYTDAAAARLGPLATRRVTRVTHTEGTFSTAEGEAAYTLVRPQSDAALPALALIATGSHGLAEVAAWLDTADDLARASYISMIVALPRQTPAGVEAAIAELAAQPGVDPARIFLFAIDQPAIAALDAASQSPAVSGIILLSPPVLQRLPDLGERPLLLMAAQKDRGGLILGQLQKLAAPLEAHAQVVALPGDGHGTYLLTSVWNAVRDNVLAWLTLHAAP